MRPPYLLIDIDGVLIPFPDPSGRIPATHGRHLVSPTGRPKDRPVPIWLNPCHGPLIKRLIDTELVTPVWATSWHRDANTLIGARIGLPVLPSIDLGRPSITTSHPHGYLWKRDPVAAWLGDIPAAWIDDDFTGLDYHWAASRTAGGVPTLLVQPDPAIGLLPEHLDLVHAWAEGPACPSPDATGGSGRN